MERVFLGFDDHFLNLVSKYLFSKYKQEGMLNLKNVLVVVTGSKTYKRLTEILLLESEKQNINFIPPSPYTPKGIFEYLINLKEIDNKKVASDFQSILIFIKAVKNLGELLKNAPELVGASFKETDSFYIALAQKIYKIYKDISGANLTFGDVKKQGEVLENFNDNRWDILEKIYIEYQKILDEYNLTDTYIKRREFLIGTKDSSITLDKDIIFLNTMDLNKVFCDILKKIKTPIQSLIFAPSELSDYFDEYGCVKVNKWIKRQIDINDDNILIADNPNDLAKLTANTIIKYSSKYAANNMVIGCTDDTLIPSIRLGAQEKNINVFSVREREIQNSSNYELIESIKSFVESNTFNNFKELVSKKDILNYLLKNNPTFTKDAILASLDDFETSYLPYYINKDSINHLQKTQFDKVIYKIYIDLSTLLEGSRSKRTLQEWSKYILNILLVIYEDKIVSKNSESDKELLTIFNSYKNAIINLNSAINDYDLEFSLQDALSLLNFQVKDTTVGMPLLEDTVEIQGWLEIQNDDSDFLILTGLKEGTWPQSTNQDEFLPNSLRKVLGLIDNDLRYARDLFMTESIINSKKEVFFIPLKYDLQSESENLLSKILLAANSNVQAKRLLSFYDSKESEAISDDELKSKKIVGKVKITDFEFFKEPVISSYDLEKISVSAISLYKSCPYRFYVQNILKLNTVNTDINELDDLMYGTLIHDVLDTFGKSKIKDSKDANEIYDYLIYELKEYVLNNFAKSHLPTIDVQLIGVKDIFRIFSFWQANHASEGWSIYKTEEKFKDYYFLVDGKKVQITGRIDRIDYNSVLDKWLIIDYKTGLTVQDKSKIYKSRKKTWLDYQMPLYLEYFNKVKEKQNVDFAYLNLYQISSPKDYFVEIYASEDELENAILETQDILRNILNGIFWPPSKESLEMLINL